jgi:hypothetical protein
MKEIKYTILYCVCDNFCDFILLRFRFRNTAKKFLIFNTAHNIPLPLSGLRLHRNTKHSQSEGFSPPSVLCDVCQKSFRNNSDLAVHKVVHTKQKVGTR